MKKTKLSVGLLAAAFLLFTGAAPRESGYSSVPEKRRSLSSRGELTEIREESVKPTEVFKNGVQELALIATDLGYLPARLIVRKNIPVRLFLTSASSTTSCFMLDEFKVGEMPIRKSIPAQTAQEVQFMPTQAGSYEFYCPVNDIHGALIVRD